ncbi:putative damage-inducible protein DinB [Pseudacidovorax sp. 1753]|uniref:DinB family protein n=1 Tax=Pseudacidovorax sp. 1753 TaxID=3156419 RepID=UPI00339756DD
MTPALCTLMADYNRWMNERLYDAAATLPEAALFEGRGAFFGSLFATLGHIVAADLIWLNRFVQLPALAGLGAPLSQLPAPTGLRDRLADSLPMLRERRMQTDVVICDMARRLAPADFDQVLRYGNTAGASQAKRFGPLLQHFFNHQTHHRGQATTLLFQAGVDVGVTDLNALIPNEV